MKLCCPVRLVYLFSLFRYKISINEDFSQLIKLSSSKLYIAPLKSNVNEITYNHLSMVDRSNFYKHAVRLLCIENQKLDSVTDDVPLYCHQTVGHGKHLGDISCQPLRGAERLLWYIFI